MRLTRTHKRRLGIGVTLLAVIAAATFTVRAVNLWQEGSVEGPLANKHSPGSSSTSGTNQESPIQSGAIDAPSQQRSSGDLASGDPFANTTGDKKIYEVAVVLESDGAMNAGYRFRDGKADGQQIADRKLTIKSSVRGPLAVAQVGVQVMNNATYATCSIFIDGVKVDSRTARKPGHVTICTG